LWNTCPSRNSCQATFLVICWRTSLSRLVLMRQRCLHSDVLSPSRPGHWINEPLSPTKSVKNIFHKFKFFCATDATWLSRSDIQKRSQHGRHRQRTSYKAATNVSDFRLSFLTHLFYIRDQPSICAFKIKPRLNTAAERFFCPFTVKVLYNRRSWEKRCRTSCRVVEKRPSRRFFIGRLSIERTCSCKTGQAMIDIRMHRPFTLYCDMLRIR
jgi:hypothetical protein